MSIGRWFRRRHAVRIEDPQQTLERAIAEHEALHGELREVALRVLYVQAKLEDEARSCRSALAQQHMTGRPQQGWLRERAEEAERQLALVRDRVQSAKRALLRSLDALATLRRERLKAFALAATQVPSSADPRVADAREQLALIEAQQEVEAALSS